MTKQDRTGTFLGGLLVGGTVGAILGLVLAPRKGKETRTILKKSLEAMPEVVEDLGTSVQRQAHRLSASTIANWEGTLERLQEAISAGVEASHLEHQRLQEEEQGDPEGGNRS